MKALSHTVMYCKYLKFYTLSLIWEILELFEHVYVVIIRYLTSYSVGSLLKFSCWCINQLLFLLNHSFVLFFLASWCNQVKFTSGSYFFQKSPAEKTHDWMRLYVQKMLQNFCGSFPLLGFYTGICALRKLQV